jgi:ABC-type branched-subunit amino acid transport system ATPase component
VDLVGPNGAGKSTLVGVISGAVRPGAGTVRFAGCDIASLSPHRIAALGLARTFHLVQPFTGLTALDCTLLGVLFGNAAGRIERVALAWQRTLEALDIVGLKTHADTPAEQLNATQRRLEIARVIAAHPRLILLDEVLSGLGGEELEQGIALVREISGRDIAIRVVEHIVRAIAALADRVLVLDRGQKVAEGSVAEVLEERHAPSSYFGLSRE